MRRLLRLRSFWCCSVILLLLGGMWVTSLGFPQQVTIHARPEIIYLKTRAGMFEIERTISNYFPASTVSIPGKYSWAPAPLTSGATAPPAPFFPLPTWKDWHDEPLNIPGTYNIGTTSVEAWKVLLGRKQMSVSLPYWLAMLVWLILCLPLLVWRWRAARRRTTDAPQAEA